MCNSGYHNIRKADYDYAHEHEHELPQMQYRGVAQALKPHGPSPFFGDLMSPENTTLAPARLEQLIARFRGRRILVVGDIILDRYVWGDVERTSPEAPTPVVRLREITAGLGGAANVVANLAALGAKASLVGIVGKDEEAGEIRARLKAIGASAAGLVVVPARPTTVKTRIVSMGQQLLRLDREQTSRLDPLSGEKIVASFEKALASAEAVILSDYDKGVLETRRCQLLINMARTAKVPVVVDPKGAEYRKYRGATVMKPNQKEAQAATGLKVDSPAALAQAAQVLLETVQSRAMIISRGGQGVSVFEKGKPPVHIPAQARQVYDVTGAGDSLVATLALSLAAGATMAEAAVLGNAAGSIVVGKLGAASVEPGELMRALQPGHAGHKLRTASQLKQELAVLRAAGKRVVFTNGCFDLIHLGHIKFIEQARQLGDVLIVAINSDASVRELKGPPRPVLGEEERAAILASLDAVDFVIIFDELTPENLLSMLQPDILVKGKGLKKQDVVGGSIVSNYGGQVIRLPLLGEMTTDSMFERIARESQNRS